MEISAAVTWAVAALGFVAFLPTAVWWVSRYDRPRRARRTVVAILVALGIVVLVPMAWVAYLFLGPSDHDQLEEEARYEASPVGGPALNAPA